jgi:aconitate hydratase
LVPGVQGGETLYLPAGAQMSIYDAANRYQADGTPLLVIAGRAYGGGSSRDWAAKGTRLLGVRAVLAESFERIHRKNLVGMGVLPLQFKPGETASSLGLTGHETYNVRGLTSLRPGKEVDVSAAHRDGQRTHFSAIARLDSPVEVTYYHNGGILHTVVRRLLTKGPP